MTIKNDFHNTSVVVVGELVDYATHWETTLSDSQMKRVKRVLCGMRDCTCGGIRGRQEYLGKKLIVTLWTTEQTSTCSV